ncbi:hypothetical protein [Sphingomonas turrisvirgatae]|uniref:Uncharacterized protein n=1 Tax=Sphingomonas turrisvirgatae TaxID=1888892 RepID=A0A1E3LYS5_9SPHN|nr:hypothetical protein [Sphingomonas turrisvirgatae]ODP38874.1 hypothetical protein BFL28_13215 [Sphingomonas turrisvirgatae]
MTQEIVALDALLTQAVDGLRTRGRNDDPGSLLKVGRFDAWLRAIDALPAGEVRRVLTAALRIELISGFPATLSHAFSDEDEDLHLDFETIGRRALAREEFS